MASGWQQTNTGYFPGQGPPPPGFKPDSFPQGQGSTAPPPYNTSGDFGNFPYKPPETTDMYNSYGDDNSPSNFGFSEKTIRMAFIRKVYSILMLQLAATMGIGTLFIAHEGTNKFVKNNPSIWLVAFVFAFVVLMIMACFDDARRKSPMNYICLTIFTLAQSVLVGVAVTSHDIVSVFWAVGICTVVCLGLTIYAFQTKIDFTMMGGFLFVAVIVLFLGGLLMIFFPTKIGIIIYASIGALIFSLYIVYDTQLMVGGEHKYSISPEEYIFASLNLYIDIINLFLYILTLVSSARD